VPEGGRLGELPDRGVVVMGGGELIAGDPAGRRLAGAAIRFASAAGYPLLADPLSGARCGQAAVAHYDLLLRDPALVAALHPELVIRLGDLPTSKPLRRWLAGLGEVRQVALDPHRAWQDPDAVVGERYAGDPVAVLEGALVAKPRAREAMWLARWLAADRAANAAIEATLGEGLSEPLVARSLAAWLPPDATLYCASSMPIRDLEEFAAVREAGPAVLANRGANGIDGTVSAAFGAAAASAGPVVLLIGDVALAHDLGGLLAARRLGLSLTIVLLDNDGGGIFHFLPVAGETDAFEEHVATPHGLQFAHAAALYGCRHTRVEGPGALREALERSLPGPGTTIIEIRTDREENLALHRRVADAALSAARTAARV
jgi:2-succinyl-5-enolpyruvyl-6-hydroxy-3-cyclohexene-1-carboxylate synthase